MRILLPEEYEKLKGLGPQDDWIPAPAASTILVAETDGVIDGFIVAQLAAHLEPIWVREPNKHPLLAAQLWANGVEYLNKLGIGCYFVWASSDQMAEYMQRLGLVELNQRSFVGGTNGGKS